MPMLTVSVSFEPSRRVWVVRRAHTIVGRYVSSADAIRGACEISVTLRQRMSCDMRIKVQGNDGQWCTYASLNDDRPAAAMAVRLLRKSRARGADPAVRCAS